jgi:CRP/FNR family transcriptional regulator
VSVTEAPLDGDVPAAVSASHLAGLRPGLVEAVLADAARLRVPAGATLRRAGDTGPHVELVVGGWLRIFVTAVDGRTLTVRYCRPGSLLGVASLFQPPYAMPASIQALTDADVLVLRPSVVRAAAEREHAVVRALAEELSERVLAFVGEIPGNAFGTVRHRVARHLLDLASERQHGPALVAPISQQALADAVGSAREVVVRVLRDLRAEGIVETRRSGIVITAPGRLLAETYPSGTQVPERTTEGR